jgi:hypothetical protein
MCSPTGRLRIHTSVSPVCIFVNILETGLTLHVQHHTTGLKKTTMRFEPLDQVDQLPSF